MPKIAKRKFDINYLYMRTEVLDLPVDILTKKETLERIVEWIRLNGKKPKMVVTAYSEFFVKGQTDKKFAEVVRKADLVTPDGRSVLAAVKYLEKTRKLKKSKIAKRLFLGLEIGRDILTNNLGESVTGVFLFEELTARAEREGWKIFLLGGWGNVSARTAKTLLERFPGIRVAYDAGESRLGSEPEVNKMVIEKINKFKPDILFVQYNPVKQEKWIAENKANLKALVIMGVGGTFNEYLGDFKKAPQWMETMGLKWLWRVIVEPKRIGRIFKAVIVFPWLVFKESLRG